MPKLFLCVCLCVREKLSKCCQNQKLCLNNRVQALLAACTTTYNSVEPQTYKGKNNFKE